MVLRGLAYRLERARVNPAIRRQVLRVERYLRAKQDHAVASTPVLFFNASTRIHTLSLNAAFSLLGSWAVRLHGIPVRYLVCQQGMDQCILGTHADQPKAQPPCAPCMRFSRRIFPDELVIPLHRSRARPPQRTVVPEKLPLEGLSQWDYRDYPLGQLCLPGLRWALRRYSLPDDVSTSLLFRLYLRSAAGLVDQFEPLLGAGQVRALVVFNGIMYPEAVAREVAVRHGIPVITHEVGLRPCSAFFSHDHATFRQVDLTDQSALEPGWEDRVEAYLQDRRAGRFSMAGIRFWPEMRPLPARLAPMLQDHRQMVAVFTNVIFDTSQSHSNVLFQDMFEWLEALKPVVASHPDTLFVFRAHPDENRPGKASRQSVSDWFRSSGLEDLDNAAMIAPDEYVSSYELLERAKCALVYSSSVGLEAAILQVPVLCAGRARYTQAETAWLPASKQAYFHKLNELLSAARIEVPVQFPRNARAFLYRELYHASLDLSEFLEPYPSLPGMVQFTDFEPQALEHSHSLTVIRDGILDGKPFLLRSGLMPLRRAPISGP